MYGLGYLCKLGDEQAVITHTPKETSDLSDSGGIGHFLIAAILPLSIAIPWADTMCSSYIICLQYSSHLEGLSFSLACSSFLNMASSLLRWLASSFKIDYII